MTEASSRRSAASPPRTGATVRPPLMTVEDCALVADVLHRATRLALQRGAPDAARLNGLTRTFTVLAGRTVVAREHEARLRLLGAE